MKVRLHRYPNGSIRWCVDYGMIGGKRKREFFPDEKAAGKALVTARAAAKRHGTQSVAMSIGERVRFTEAAKRLALTGATIEQAVDYFLTRRARVTEIVTVRELVDLCIEAKRGQGRRAQYLRMLRVAPLRLPDMLAADVGPAHVRAMLAGQSITAKTRNNWLGDIRAIWKWGADHGLTADDPTGGVPRFADDRGEIEFLSTKQVGAIFETCPPDLLAFHALGIFAGIRPEEIRRMTWADVRIEESTATVRATSSKTRQRRVVELEPAAVSYLTHCAAERVTNNSIVRPRCEMQLAEFRRSLGHPWPHDAMRHTYATMHFAHFRDEKRLQANMGHRSGAMLFQHYRALASASEAAAFWALRPALPAAASGIAGP